MVNGKRLLFFDILRIVAVTAVVYSHIIMFQGIIPRPEDLLVFNFVYYGIGIVGVYILLFVSGAVLEYSYPNLNTFDDIVNFYQSRVGGFPRGLLFLCIPCTLLSRFQIHSRLRIPPTLSH